MVTDVRKRVTLGGRQHKEVVLKNVMYLYLDGGDTHTHTHF